MAIGARSQSARTYLEKNYTTFENCNSSLSITHTTGSLDELIRHALLAVRESLASSAEGLTIKNCSVGIVGENQPFEILEGDRLQAYVSTVQIYSFLFLDYIAQ